MMKHGHHGIHPVALGLSLGVVWGISILLMGLLSYFFNYGEAFVTAVGTLYVGYNTTILGSIIGGIIGFIDAFIGGFFIGLLYNLFACHCSHCPSKNEKGTKDVAK